MPGYVAIALALAVSGVPASLAQDSRGLERCEPGGTGTEAEERQTNRMPGSNAGVFIERPIGGVCVSPEFLGGEPIYVGRTTVGSGMIVEVSTTAFMPEGAPGVGALIARPDQPASW